MQTTEYEPPGIYEYVALQRSGELDLIAVERQPPAPRFEAIPEPAERLHPFMESLLK